MSKRRSGERDGLDMARSTRRHLYLVLDDWSLGYTIRKINLSADCDPNHPGQQIASGVALKGAFCFSGKQCLPPAILRFIAACGLPMYFAAAFDFFILAMQPIDPSFEPPLGPFVSSSPVSYSLVPGADVGLRCTTYAPRPTTDPVDPIYIPVSDMLFTLAAGSFEMLHYKQMHCMPAWLTLAKPPFERKHVTSYALHPDGRIFVSINTPAQAATFTFNTAEQDQSNCEWKQQYQCMMPFAGQVHFDPALDAFVGFSIDPATIGHLCSVNVPRSSRVFGALNLCKEKLISNDDPLENQEGATLVYMGGQSYFCLVQCIFDDEMNDDSSDETNDSKLDNKNVPQFSRHSFRLTTFFLEYDKNGDLRVCSRRVRYYSVPEDVTELALRNPVAFWM